MSLMEQSRWPATTATLRPIGDLVPSARNARRHSQEQVQKIADSIRTWGWTTSVLIDESGEIIAGHGRVLAAELIGIEQVPCIVATGWSDQDKQAYGLADNKLAEISTWDDAALSSAVGELSKAGFDLGLAGFSDDEITAALGTKPVLRERTEIVRTKRYIRALVSVPIESAAEMQSALSAVSEIAGAQIDYGAN